ncbi:hypothetical protein Misp01_24600 [Microtetraspora sp. NBRC 13810]|uniref:DUF6292 family protein n=1 Tax=Microtetraspora sp. NBRC 13810 TaxID=3030990 RepID=UPI0024A0A55F|nr:DUF6292 family protein [Microtetraspora sp. NBRC 13810]GLW07330.1 hypothetical protein Misp01_24600 [Microtetraspora sp. NBRC 13810]
MTVKHVEPFTDEWRQQPGSYLRQVVEALGGEVDDWWEGPCDPRRATVRLTDGTFLIWDEESGWRHGTATDEAHTSSDTHTTAPMHAAASAHTAASAQMGSPVHAAASAQAAASARPIASAQTVAPALTGVRYLGGGVLPRPDRVPAALADARAGVGNSTAWRPCYRSHRRCHDGFDLALAAYTPHTYATS